MRCILEINVGLLYTADNSVPVSSGDADGSRVDRNGRGSGRPPPKVLLKLRHYFFIAHVATRLRCLLNVLTIWANKKVKLYDIKSRHNSLIGKFIGTFT